MNRNSTYRAAGALALAATTIVGAPAASAQDDAQAPAQSSASSSKGGIDAIGLTGLGAAVASGAGLVYLQRERRNERSKSSHRR